MQDVSRFVWVHEKPSNRFVLINLSHVVGMASDSTGGTYMWLGSFDGKLKSTDAYNVTENIMHIANEAQLPTIGID